VITGEDAEPARVERQALVQPVFGAEVGDEVLRRIERSLHPCIVRFLQVAAIGRQHGLVFLQEHGVRCRGLERRLRDPAQEHLRVVTAGVPQLPVEISEKILDASIPGIGQVVRQARQAREGSGQHGLNLELDAGFAHGGLTQLGLHAVYSADFTPAANRHPREFLL